MQLGQRAAFSSHCDVHQSACARLVSLFGLFCRLRGVGRLSQFYTDGCCRAVSVKQLHVCSLFSKKKTLPNWLNQMNLNQVKIRNNATDEKASDGAKIRCLQNNDFKVILWMLESPSVPIPSTCCSNLGFWLADEGAAVTGHITSHRGHILSPSVKNCYNNPYKCVLNTSWNEDVVKNDSGADWCPRNVEKEKVS